MPVRKPALKSLFAIVILALLVASGAASAEGKKGAKGAGKTRITASCKPCQPTADKLGVKIDEQKRLAKRAKELWDSVDRIYDQVVSPLSNDVWDLETKVKDLTKKIAAQKKTLRDLRVEQSMPAHLRAADVNFADPHGFAGVGLNARDPQVDDTLHELQDLLVRVQSNLAHTRGQYDRARRRERDERLWSLKIGKQAELMQGEVDGLRRALEECEKQCKGQGPGGTSGTVGGGAGTTTDPTGKASTRCRPCDGTAKAINSAMDDLRSLRAKKAEAERKHTAAFAEWRRVRHDINTIERGLRHLMVVTMGRGSEAARDERRHLRSLRETLKRAHEEWTDAAGEVYRLDKAIEKKKAELGALRLHLSECEKKCRLKTKTSLVDPTTPKNQALAHSSSAAFGGGRERPRTFPPGAHYGSPGPTASDAMADGLGLALGMAGSVPVPAETPEPEPVVEVDEPVTTNPCDHKY